MSTRSVACPSEDELTTAAAGRADPLILEHAEACAGCRAVIVEIVKAARQGASADPVADQMASNPTALPIGTKIDRFEIEGRVGTGAMGVVYAAHDPKLQRSVALKIMRSAANDASRLEREAQAAAQVTHPNVVTVYDVGSHGDQMFVAMELVRGDTLRTWLQTPRGWRDVLAKLIEAARGIAAVHAAGLVHRDFKPDNVLIGADGRARVSDFGLARSTERIGGHDAGSPFPRSPHLTQTGSFVGTPAYAAPEQLSGGKADALSDQFAFAVTAWESLYGERPFQADTIEQLAQQHLAGIPAPSRARGVPAALQRVLRRALALAPERRYPTIQDLVRALEAAARPMRYAIGLGVSAVVLLAAVGFAVRTHRDPPPCGGLEAPLAGVWDLKVRTDLLVDFAASGHPNAPRRFATVSRGLDQYARKWSAQRAESCIATRIRGEQSEAQLDARMRCLDDRLSDLRDVTRELVSAPRDVVDRAPAALALLRDPATCQHPSDAGSPSGPNAASIQAIRHELDKLPSLMALHGVAAGRSALDPLRTKVAALGDPGLDAEFQMANARIAVVGGDLLKAADELRRVVVLAERGRYDRLRALAAVALVSVAVELRSFDEAERMADLGDAVIARIGGDPDLEVELLGSRGRLATAKGRPGDAIELLERARISAEKRDPNGLAVASILHEQNNAYMQLGRHADATRVSQRANAIVAVHYGDDDAGAGARLYGQAQEALTQGEFRRAVELGERALVLLKRTRAPDDEALHALRMGLYAAYSRLRQWDHARRHIRDALAIAQTSYHEANAATALELSAKASQELGDLPTAIAEYRASVGLATKIHDDLQTLYSRYGLGRALAAVHDEAAIPELEWALAKLEAITPLRRNQIGGAQASLAEALWRRNARSDRARGLGAAAAARVNFAAHRDRFQDDVLGGVYRRAMTEEINAIDRWISEHSK